MVKPGCMEQPFIQKKLRSRRRHAPLFRPAGGAGDGGGDRRGVGYGRFVERKREKSSYFEIPKVFMPEKKKSTFGPEINIVCLILIIKTTQVL